MIGAAGLRRGSVTFSCDNNQVNLSILFNPVQTMGDLQDSSLLNSGRMIARFCGSRGLEPGLKD